MKKMMDHFRDLRLLPISFFTLFLYVFSIDSLIRLNYVRQMVCMETATTTTNSVLQQWTSTGRIFSNEFEIFKLKFNFKSTFNRKTHKLSWVASMCVCVCARHSFLNFLFIFLNCKENPYKKKKERMDVERIHRWKHFIYE